MTFSQILPHFGLTGCISGFDLDIKMRNFKIRRSNFLTGSDNFVGGCPKCKLILVKLGLNSKIVEILVAKMLS